MDATRERPSSLAITATDSFLTRRRAVNRYLRAALDHRIEERIARVDARVVVVRGERDPLVPRAVGTTVGRCRTARSFPRGAGRCARPSRPPRGGADLLVEVASSAR